MSRLKVLGPPLLLDGAGADTGLPAGKPMALLAYLVVEARPIPRDELADLLWPASSRDRGRQSVRQALWLLRKHLGGEPFLGSDPVSLVPDVLGADLHQFIQALEKGAVPRARELWRGPFLARFVLPDVPALDEWVDVNREKLNRRFSVALTEAAKAHLEQGLESRALELLEQAVGVNPLHLDGWSTYVAALLDAGELDRARQTLEEARARIGDLPDAPDVLSRLEDRYRGLRRSGRTREGERERLHLEFVGRTRELADLRGLWRRARAGQGASVAVVGPTGIGKSRLAEEVLHIAESQGASVVRVKAHPGDSRVRWGVAADLARELLSLPGAAGISGASDAVFRHLLPSLDGGGNGNGHGEPDPTVRLEAVSLGDALYDVMEAVSWEGPLALFVDDLQWADKASRVLLARLGRRLASLHCLLIVATRDREERPTAERSARRVGADAVPERLLLVPLTREEVAELVGLEIRFADPGLEHEVVARIHAATRGNPLFLIELIREWSEAGVLVREEEGWLFGAADLEDLPPLPESVQEVIRARLTRVGDEGRAILNRLAHESGPTSPHALRKMSGVAEDAFARTVGDLVAAEVLRWGEHDELDFTHDRLREAVRAMSAFRTDAPRPLGSRRAKVLAAAIFAVALLSLIPILGSREAAQAGVGDTYEDVYYGGSVLLLNQREIFELRPPGPGQSRWTLRSKGRRPPTTSGQPVPSRLADGSLTWYMTKPEPGATPYVARLDGEGRPHPIFSTSGDDSFRDISPDGRKALITTENLETPQYDLDLLTLDLDTRRSRRVYRSNSTIRDARWAPDGQKLAFVLVGSRDTVVVISPLGGERYRRTLSEWPDLGGLDWCPDSRHMVFHTSAVGRGGLAVWDLEEDTVEIREGSLGAPSNVACLGSAAALTHVVIDTDGPHIRVRDLVRDTVFDIKSPSLTRPILWRVPGGVRATVERVTVSGSPLRLGWGESGAVHATAGLSDGSRHDVDVAWVSRDPRVASVRPDGTIIGNRTGSTCIVGVYEGWLRDSIRVEVLPPEGPLLFMSDAFSTFPSDRWEVLASPEPMTRRLPNGAPVLSLRGDGRYADAIVTRQRFPVGAGLTLDLDFKLSLSRSDRQRLGVCLSEVEPPAAGSSRHSSEWVYGPGFCFFYPGRELAKFDPREGMLSLTFLGYTRTVELPPYFPTEEWVSLSLQLQPDGTASVLVDRQPVAEMPLPLAADYEGMWRVWITGASVDTELLIRDLALWRGARYEPGSQDP